MEAHGALVGWGHHDNGDRLMLRLETIRSSGAAERREPDIFRILMSKQQAVVLGTYLIEQAGQSGLDPLNRSWFRRLFG